MILFLVVISLGLGLLLEKDRQIGDETSCKMRYRMISLDLPNVTSHIDSTYSVICLSKEKKNGNLKTVLNVNEKGLTY